MSGKNVKKPNKIRKNSARRVGSSVVKKISRFARDKKSISYQNYLIETLKDPEEAAGYLNAALFGGDIRVFLLALQNVVEAQGGVKELAERTHKSRTSLYKSLSEKGNPYLKSANDLLIAMGMHFSVIANRKSAGGR